MRGYNNDISIPAAWPKVFSVIDILYIGRFFLDISI
jgi:hypothetical protein